MLAFPKDKQNDVQKSVAEAFASANREWISALPDADIELLIQDLGPKTFTLFPKLPPELRSHIWQASFPPGRRIKAYAESYGIPTAIYTHPTPVAFRINRESRQESKLHYETLFEACVGNYHVPPLYLRASVDTLMISYLRVFNVDQRLERHFRDPIFTTFGSSKFLIHAGQPGIPSFKQPYSYMTRMM
jgi:hypothetical protein